MLPNEIMFDFNLASEFIVKSPESVAEPSKLTTNAFEGFAPARPFDESTSPLPITKATPGGVPVYSPSA